MSVLCVSIFESVRVRERERVCVCESVCVSFESSFRQRSLQDREVVSREG